jgi:hypothetical protein
MSRVSLSSHSSQRETIYERIDASFLAKGG